MRVSSIPEMRPRAPRYARNSGASGARTSTRSPVRGCAKTMRAACRKVRPSLGRALVADARHVRRAIDGVASNRMADRGKMHANLVRAAGVQPRFHQRERFETQKHAPVRARLAPFAAPRGHAGAPYQIARDRQRDRAGIFRQAAMKQRQIVFLNVPLLKLIGQRAMRRVISRHHQARPRFRDRAGARFPGGPLRPLRESCPSR